MTKNLNSDDIDRTVLISIHDGSRASLDAALKAFARTGIILCADSASCQNVNGQAALLTAVLTSVRAFGNVLVVTDLVDTRVHRGIYKGQNLLGIIRKEGATVLSPEQLTVNELIWPILLIGSHADIPDLRRHSQLNEPPVLRASWKGWRACVAPPSSTSEDNKETNFMLAPIAAAALGVSEIFGWWRHLPGSDAGYRESSLNLWSPTEIAEAPDFEQIFAPNAWWLVGLGHLGQANAWVISCLGYDKPSDIEIVLQDTDRTVPANFSTGVLTPKDGEARSKARLLAEMLDQGGFETRIIERRLGTDLRVTPEERHHVALIGVDNINARRLTSDVGWRFAIDAGLGNGPTNFDSILFKRFPGRIRSDQVESWKDETITQVKIPNTAGFENLRKEFDECGVVELAGQAVGASFVGILAATISISLVICELLGGEGIDQLRVDLASMFTVSAPSTGQADLIGTPLNNSHEYNANKKSKNPKG